EDPKMASRNLPSYVIDKVQVTDDKEELLRRGNDNLNNVGKVINLTLKNGMKKGIFGKEYAGGGGGPNGGRFEAGAIANVFRDTMQVSLLGYTNNLNRPGFNYSDILNTGGMGRTSGITGSRSISINNSDYGSGITVNGINFGGLSPQGGISTSSGLGVNFNHSPNKKQSVYAQYFFGNVKTDLAIKQQEDITNNNEVITNKTDKKGTIINNAHNIGAGIKLTPDSVTTFSANVNYIIGGQQTNNENISESTNSAVGLLNTGHVSLDNKLTSNQYSHYISFVKQSKHKKGRRISLSNKTTWQKNVTDAYTDGTISYNNPTVYDSSFAQLRNERVPTFFTNFSTNYSEPIAENWFIRAGITYEYETLKNNTSTFLKNGNIYNNPVDDLTSRFNRTSNRLGTLVGVEYKYKSLRVTPALKFQYQQFQNQISYINHPVVQKISNILPQLNITYKDLDISYNRDVILPDYQYLIPVRNNTNPYYVNLGNADLLPAVKDEVYVNYNHYSTEHSFNFWGWASMAFTNKDVVQSIVIDESGIQTLLPINADGSKIARANFGINKDYKNKSKFTFSWNLGSYMQYKQNLFYFNNDASQQKNAIINGWGGIGLNWNDVVEWNNSMGITYSNVKNTNEGFANFKTVENSIATEFVLRWPKHVIFETKASYGTNSQIVTDDYRHYLLWNAAVNFTMFKDERGVLKLGVYDILNQSRSVDVYSNQNIVKTSYNNIIGQYFMATFTYNIRAAGAKKKVGGSMFGLF
ncbi:MAG: outer membrane beta-barrel protein, partial [Niabella sp.]